MDTNPTSIQQFDATPKQQYPFELSARLAWAMALEGCSRAAWSVAISLANHASRETGRCWPGMGLIAEETRMSRASVIRGVRELEQGFGLVVKRVRAGKICERNRYQLPKFSPKKPDEKPDDPSVTVQPPYLHTATNPSVTVQQQPVTQPVREPKQQRAIVPKKVQATKSQSQTRHYCETHKRSWPGQYGEVCFLCDRENLKPKSGGDSFRDMMRRKGLITPEDDRAYDARQEAFRAKMFPRSDARTRKIDQERRARRKSGGGFTRAGVT